MNDQLQTILRAVLKIGGGYLVASGMTDNNSVEIITAGLLTLIGVVWGILHRTPAPSAGPATPTQSGRTQSLFPVILAVGLAGFLSGCASPQSDAFKAESAAQTGVETALAGWNVYVGNYHPGTNTEWKVMQALNIYKASELLAIDATQAWIRDTNSPTATATLQ